MKILQKKDEIKHLSSIMDYNDDEMNDLSYDSALKNDKRYYWYFYNKNKT